MLNKLPKELHNHVLDYAFGCRKDQNFYVNKEVVIYVSEKCNPQVIDLIKTRIEPFGLELLIGNQSEFIKRIC